MNKNTKKKIGVTVRSTSLIWSNGLNQNSYFLIKMLEKLGYQVDGIASKSDKEDEMTLIDIPKIKLTEGNIKEYFLIIEVAFMIDLETEFLCKKNGVKIVSVNYGNSLFYLMEGSLFKKDQTTAVHREGVNTLISPHYEFGKKFLENTTRAKLGIIPYIWEPWFINGKLNQSFKINSKYHENVDKTKVASLEPNISIAKTCVIPLLIAENLHRKKESLITEVNLYGTKHLEERENLKLIIKNTDLNRYNKIKLDYRFSIIRLFNENKIGTIISNHYYNDLNYLTLEAFYLRYPIVHNSEFCKEAGYFYQNFDVKKASEKLEQAIKTDDHLDKNNIEASKEVLWKFSIHNPDVQAKYSALIKNI
jgi:hypothetical protein